MKNWDDMHRGLNGGIRRKEVEASELELLPGEWPMSIQLTCDAREMMTLHRDRVKHGADGDILWVDYVAPVSIRVHRDCRVLRVFND
jgi:hypothetical protein